ncbi:MULTISPECIES: zinc-dependent alcohol dehydrogenase family protein [Aurantimonas]|uniref:zinc-dependent alcohol dehydrogenase family protein n=1 Tax=Aurantimonas TaxID=182269 RepID=UPI000462C824|nr:zinc-dependent alcohol dehydrogenase family protein [Aurantimonas coralicida]
MSTAQRVVYRELGGPEVLKLEPLDLPEPGRGEVQLRILAVGTNRFDALMRRDHYVIAPAFPSAMGNEAVGVVNAVGADVSHVAPGDRVAVLPVVSPIMGTGTYATDANVPAHAVASAIAELTSAEEAGLWMAALQAWNMMARHDLPAGTWVLVTAATSAVGLMALQMARDLGLRAIATTRRKDAETSLLATGAAAVIVTRSAGDLAKGVEEITGGAGVGLVIEAVGGDTLAECIGATAEGAHIISYGAQSSPDFKAARVNLPLIALDRRTLTFSELFEVTENAERFAAARDYIREAVRRGALRPVIDRTFPLTEVQAAHRYLESGRLTGKVVLCATEEVPC